MKICDLCNAGNNVSEVFIEFKVNSDKVIVGDYQKPIDICSDCKNKIVKMCEEKSHAINILNVLSKGLNLRPNNLRSNIANDATAYYNK